MLPPWPDTFAPKPRGPAPVPAIRTSFLLLALVTFTLVIATKLLAPKFGGGADPQRTTTRQYIADLSSQLQRFHDDTGCYPATTEGLNALCVRPPATPAWRGPYVNHLPLDPWRHPFIYTASLAGDPPTLQSAGKDGVLGTPDDITNITSP